MASRQELGEREVSCSQTAADRQDEKGFQVWTNDPYWLRRLDKIGAEVVSASQDGKTYRLDQTQVLFRKVPMKRKSGAEVVNRLKARAERAAMSGDSPLMPQ